MTVVTSTAQIGRVEIRNIKKDKRGLKFGCNVIGGSV